MRTHSECTACDSLHKCNHDRVAAANAARRAAATVPHAHRPGLAREYLETNITLQELGDRYGVTREYIRQIIRDHDPTIPRRRQDRRRQESQQRRRRSQWARLWELCRQAVDEDRHCVACGGWVIRDTGQDTDDPTCSHECSVAWKKALRIFDDPDHHRRAMAKVYLAAPEKYEESKIEWARRMLSDDPPPRNRTYLVPGSKRAEIIRKYRPERYEELTGEKP